MSRGCWSRGTNRPSANPYGAPVLFVSKKDGGWRSGVDYRVVKSYFLYLPEHVNRLWDCLAALGKRGNCVLHCPNALLYQLKWIPALSEGGFQEVALFTLKGVTYLHLSHICVS